MDRAARQWLQRAEDARRHAGLRQHPRANDGNYFDIVIGPHAVDVTAGQFVRPVGDAVLGQHHLDPAEGIRFDDVGAGGEELVVHPAHGNTSRSGAGAGGFSGDTGLPAAEYWSAGLFLEPLSLPVLNPALHAGVLLPISNWDRRGVRWQLGGELSVVEVPAPLLKPLFYNEINWSPGTGVEALVLPDFSAATAAVLIAPLRFRAGDGVFSLCAAYLLFELSEGYVGWGITLFRAALFLW